MGKHLHLLKAILVASARENMLALTLQLKAFSLLFFVVVVFCLASILGRRGDSSSAVFYSGAKMDLARGGAKSQERHFEAKSAPTASVAGFCPERVGFFFPSFSAGGGLSEPGTFFFVRRATAYFYLPGPNGSSASSCLILAGIPGYVFFSLSSC